MTRPPATSSHRLPPATVFRDIGLYRIGAGADEIMLDVTGRSYGF